MNSTGLTIMLYDDFKREVINKREDLYRTKLKRKIDTADEIFVINVGGYTGDSTRSEIEYAVATGKSIRYSEEKNPSAV